jgi:hypothetical protein
MRSACHKAARAALYWLTSPSKMESGYPLLLRKLDEFIRKYYNNQLIRGAIYFVTAVLLSFLVVMVLEYFGRYSSAVRAVLLYSFLAFTAWCLVRFILYPLAGLYRIGRRLTYDQAANIIGLHFPEVSDKLINTLQLKKNLQGADNSLLEAAIDQKIGQLRPVPFTAAIDLRRNLRYLRYAGIPVLIFISIYLVSPGMISDTSERIIRYDQAFAPKAPFTFNIENEDLRAEQYSDFELRLRMKGAELPADVYIVLNGARYKMEKQQKALFTYTFANVQRNTPFVFGAGSFESDEYKLEVVAKPMVLSYQAALNYPAYTGRKDEVVNNPGDLNIPVGTTVTWKFLTRQADEVILGFNGQLMKASSTAADHFTYSKKFFVGGSYYVRTSNSGIPSRDSMLYQVNVMPDAYPSISVEGKEDSLTGRQVYFIGDVSDDYGVSKLLFRYRFTKSENEARVSAPPVTRSLTPGGNGLSQRFYHQFDLSETGLEPGDELEYYFEVWDNDGVHGPKSSKSKMMQLRAPSLRELEEKQEAGSSAMKEKMEEAVKEAKALQKELKDLERKMLEKRELTWEEKKKLEELLQKQKDLNKKIEEIKQEHQQQNQKEAEFRKQSEEILAKQKELERMFNEVITDDMKKMMQQLERMMQMQNKDMIRQEMEKMKMTDKDVEKELDRMLEQYKVMEIEKKLEQAMDKLDKLAAKQDKLAQKTKDFADKKGLDKEQKEQTQEELKKEQQKLEQEFKELQKDLADIEKKNKELETPQEIEKGEEEQKEIEKELDKSEEELEKKDNKKASDSQKKAADEMKQMKDKMQKSMAEKEEKELELDIDAMREILENTVQLSKDQEDLMERLRQVNGYNPQFVELAQEQKKVQDNAKIIEDSLLALSKRVPEIKSFVNREVSRLNENLERSVKGFGQRNFMEIRTRQQYAMTHANNLAVMLSDILGQMQAKQSDGQGKKGKSRKPGKGKGSAKGEGNKPSMGQLKKMQEELNRQLREGLNKNGTGDKKGGEKPGEKPGAGGQGGMGSEQFARMAAQQQAIRQQMQQMMKQLGSKEKEQLGGAGQMQELQRLMEQTEKELFNKRLSGELLQRQQDILTRLLESEKAERRQEEDNRREAEQAKEKPRAAPPDFEKYIRQKNREKELLETIPAELQPYYKEKAKEYFNRIGTK